jgi:hypothetical protein
MKFLSALVVSTAYSNAVDVEIYFFRNGEPQSWHNKKYSSNVVPLIEQHIRPAPKTIWSRLFAPASSLSKLGHEQVRSLGVKVFRPRANDSDRRGNYRDRQFKDTVGPKLSTSKVAYGVSNHATAQESMVDFLEQRKEVSEPVEIQILNCLQEEWKQSSNVGAKNPGVAVAKLLQNLPGYRWTFGNPATEIVDYSKAEKHVDMTQRFGEFVRWVNHEAKTKDTFVIAGHSDWLMQFFGEYLKMGVPSELEQFMRLPHLPKLGYASMVKFVFRADPNGATGEIVAHSTTVVTEIVGNIVHDAREWAHPPRVDERHLAHLADYRRRKHDNKFEPPSLRGRF